MKKTIEVPLRFVYSFMLPLFDQWLNKDIAIPLSCHMNRKKKYNNASPAHGIRLLI